MTSKRLSSGTGATIVHNTTTATANLEPGLLAIWQRLELYKAQKPLVSKRCRECGAAQVETSLCEKCDERRERLKMRLGRHVFRAPSNMAISFEELEHRFERPASESTVRVQGRPYRLPYPDDTDD